MPAIAVVFFQEANGSSEVVAWLRDIRVTQPKVFAKLAARLQLLSVHGHQLRRPIADYLRDGIYELRQRHGSVNYRLLYFFHGNTVAVIAAGLTKEDAVPIVAINQAIAKKLAFSAAPMAHTFSQAQ